MSLNKPVQPSANGDAPVRWFKAEEEAMVSFLATHKAEAGDGFNFKEATWSKVAAHLKPPRTEGGVKTAKKCTNKWGWVHGKSVITNHAC
jgi:hypothetical protein